MSDRTAVIQLQIRNQASPELRTVAAGYRDLIVQLRAAGQTQQQAERAALSYAQALQRQQVAAGQAERGQQQLAAALSQVDRSSIAAIRAETQQINTQRRLAAEAERAAAAQQQAERAALQHAQALARLYERTGQGARAVRELTNALSQVDRSSTAAIRTETQLIATQDRLARSWGTQALEQFKQGLVGFAAPAAVANTALTLITGTAQSFRDAFVFKAELDATTTSIAIQLRGVRDSGAAFAQATAFADRYKLTQQEVNQALQASVGILRQSRSGADELLGVLARMQVLSPEQGLEGAALALKELQSGQTTSLVTRFEVSRTAANRLKQEIEGGADAVQVMARYLNDAGVTMGALEARTTGAMGKLNELKRAQEELALAQARFAEGPGMEILRLRIEATRGATQALSGDIRGVGTISDTAGQVAGASWNYPLQAVLAYNGAVLVTLGNLAGLIPTHEAVARSALGNAAASAQAAFAAQQITDAHDRHRGTVEAAIPVAQQLNQTLAEQAQKTLEAKLQTEQMATFQQTLANLGSQVAGGLLTSGEAADILRQKYAGLGDEALKLIGLQAQLAQADAAAQIAAGRDQVGKRWEAMGAAAKELRDARERQTLQTGTAAEKEIVLQKQLQRAKDTYGTKSVQYVNAETALIAHRQQQQEQADRASERASKSRISDAKSVLNLTERTADAEERRAKAIIDARLGALDDRKQRRIEARELAAAQRLLASGRGSADQRAAAQDVMERIPLEQQKRALEIASRTRDAGGSIIGGKLYGTVPGGGVPAPPTGALPSAPAVPGVAAMPGGGVPVVEVLVQLDSEPIAARIDTRLRAGLHQARAGGAGGG